MIRPGLVRDRLAGALEAAFADGLISEHTLSHRLALVFGGRIVDPGGVVGDLGAARPAPGGLPRRLALLAAAARRELGRGGLRETAPAPLLLALDWSQGDRDLLIGRGEGCDLELAEPSVSRIHARLAFRGGAWIIQDLASTNGTWVNGREVGRFRLRPGDRVSLGSQRLEID